MENEEIETPDEWQELADDCSEILKENNVSFTVKEEGLLDLVQAPTWELFREYTRFVSVYTFSFVGFQEAELVICATRLPEMRPFPFATGYRVGAPYFDEIQSMMVDISDARLFGAVRLENDPGYIYIQPRDIASTLSDIFQPAELAIEGFSKFRHNFQFDSQDPQLAEEVLTPDFFSLISQLNEPYIEIKDGLLVVGFKTPCEEEQVVTLANFVCSFAKVISG